jgi:glycosyltransferase involved in cell wall biosynthesis
MRIAFLSHQWPGARMGGIGTCVRQTAVALAGAGHEVHVFTLTLPADVRRDLPPGIRVHECAGLSEAVHDGTVPAACAAALAAGGSAGYRLALAWRLTERLLAIHEHQRFDLVEAPEVEALGLPLLLGDFHAPVVSHLHCATGVARIANGAPADEDSAAAEALELAAIHLADGACAPTAAVIDSTRELGPIRHDVQVIPHPVSITDAEPHSPPRDDGPILFVGRLERLKGVEVLAEALNLFLPTRPAARFRFIGPDTNVEGASMRQGIEGRLLAPVRPRVEFAGERSPAEIRTAWRGARFGVMPSLRENFSMALCEALSAGRTAIIASGTGSVEVVGEAGLVVERGSAAALAAAMGRLWDDRTLLHRLSAAAFDRIRTVFSPASISTERTAFYQSVIDSFRRGGAMARSARLASLPPGCAAAVLPAMSRLTAALAGVKPPGARTPGMRLLQIMDDLERRHGTPARVLLYGAGKHSARLMAERHLWETRRHRVVGIIDDHPRFHASPVYLDLPVQSVGAAAARVAAGEALAPVVLSTDTYEDQFWAQCAPLRAAGVPVFRLYTIRKAA